MSSKLTKTEELAARLYFNDKLKPKEIAQKLGISVNTVYKAISKYRALLKNVEQDGTVEDNGNNTEFNNNEILSPSSYSINLSVIMGQPIQPLINEATPTNDINVITELRELRKLIEELLVRISRLETLNCKSNSYISTNNTGETKISEEPLPEFLRDNPWIDVLRSIHS